MSSRLAAALAALAAGCLKSPPDSGGGERCGTLGALQDDFEVDDLRWVREGSAIADGRLELYATSASSSAAITSWKYQLDGEVTMQFRNLGLLEGQLKFLLVDAAGNSIGIAATEQTIRLVLDVDGQQTGPAADDFDPAMLWWKLAVAGDQLTWATSSDGQVWEEHAPVELPLSGPVGVVLELTTEGIQSDVNIEAVNSGGTEAACPAGSLVDDFEVETARWEPSSAAQCSVHSDGQLVIEYDGMEYCGLFSAERFDLRGSAIGLEVVDVGDCNPSFTLTADLIGQQAEISCYNVDDAPYLAAGVYGEGGEPGTLATVDFDPAQHRLWRIASTPDGDALQFQTASTGADWQTLATEPMDPAALMLAGVSLLVTDDSPDGDLDPVILDHFNTASP